MTGTSAIRAGVATTTLPLSRPTRCAVHARVVRLVVAMTPTTGTEILQGICATGTTHILTLAEISTLNLSKQQKCVASVEEATTQVEIGKSQTLEDMRL